MTQATEFALDGKGGFDNLCLPIVCQLFIVLARFIVQHIEIARVALLTLGALFHENVAVKLRDVVRRQARQEVEAIAVLTDHVVHEPFL